MFNDDGASGEKSLTLECAVRTDVGLIRARNEDAAWADAGRGWLLLADGMGGYSSGDLASALAVSYAQNRLRRDAAMCDEARCSNRAGLLVAGIADANAAIRAIVAQSAGKDMMGSTFVGALLEPDEVVYAYIGDSRLYVLRAGALTRLSCDHTLVQELVDAGRLSPDAAQVHPSRGLLTRGLGIQNDVEPGTGTHALQAEDRLLLCTDGLTDMVDEDEIAVLLGAPAPVEEVAVSLIEAAKTGGGRDNITVIVAWFAAQAQDCGGGRC
ncbi:MAG: protein phosphatase 2C domain-containing protein [Azoarcus sp.]|jgi:protein phosphatase|nr:protein phosphatase 2C domain-containing protein [Azoarcus sp.]